MSKEKLNEQDLENVSGGAGVRLPEAMQGMDHEELSNMFNNEEFRESRDFNMFMDMNGMDPNMSTDEIMSRLSK